LFFSLLGLPHHLMHQRFLRCMQRARTVPLALITLATLGRKSWTLPVGTLARAVQLLDAGVGLFQHDLEKDVGPLLIAGPQFLALFNLMRPMPKKASLPERL